MRSRLVGMSLTAVAVSAVLAIAGCTVDPTVDTAAGTEEERFEEPGEVGDGTGAESASGDSGAGITSAGNVFDPDQEVLFKEIVFTPMFGDPTTPFSNLLIPDDMPWPATLNLVQTAVDTSKSAEPVASTNGAFRTTDTDAVVEVVMGFFFDRLPDQGWELDQERIPGEGVHWTQWLRRIPHENPERSYEVEFRIEYLGPEREISNEGILRFWIRTREVFAAFEG
jgi:hypothetical protein